MSILLTGTDYETHLESCISSENKMFEHILITGEVMHHSSTFMLHVGLPAEYPWQSAVCGSVRSVDGRDGN